jgi:hypothetical protein
MAVFKRPLPHLKDLRAPTVATPLPPIHSLECLCRWIYVISTKTFTCLASMPKILSKLTKFLQILALAYTHKRLCLSFLSLRIGPRTHLYQSTLTLAPNKNHHHLNASTNISALPARPARKISQFTVYQYPQHRHRLRHLIVRSSRRRTVPHHDT